MLPSCSFRYVQIMRHETDEGPEAALGVENGTSEGGPKATSFWSRVQFIASWVIAIALIAVVLPAVLNISWSDIWEAMSGLGPGALLLLFVLWIGGLLCHTFVLVAAAPDLTNMRALTLNLTGSAISNVVPMGGAAGMELNRRMMKVWGIDTKTFAGFTFLTNLWDVASKFLLPVFAIAILALGETDVSTSLMWTALGAALGFVLVCAFGVIVLRRPSAARAFGGWLERFLNACSRLIRRPREFHLTDAMLEIRRESLDVVRSGWLQMSTGMFFYVALQGALLWACLDVTGANAALVAVLVAYAVERLLTVLPITPGGVGVADIGLVGVLIALGADPAGAAAGAVLYRAFVFVLEIPIGGGAMGVWVFARWRRKRRDERREATQEGALRIAHVTDVFLPALGGIETHVDDLVRHQIANGQDAQVLTPASGNGDDPDWVRRVSVREARRAVTDYDVLHIHISILSPFGLAVAMAAITQRVPVLITMHSMWAGRGTPVRIMGRAMLRRWPVAWSAVSGAAARVFRDALPGTQVHVLADAIDVDKWRPDAEQSARKDAALAAGGPLTVVSVMRLAPRKRPLALVKAFQHARTLVGRPELRLVLVGDGPERRKVEKYVARHHLGDAVVITGRLPRAEVHAHLAEASIYVAPTPKEAFGIAALEARCAGLPIIASRRSGVADFVRDRVDGILIDSDAQMTGAIAELAAETELRDRITDHNRRVQPAFDWTDALVRTSELYEHAVARMNGLDVRVPRPAALVSAGVSVAASSSASKTPSVDVAARATA